MEVSGSYDDGSQDLVTNYTFSPNTPLTTSDNIITVSVDTFSDTVAITVNPVSVPVVESIDVTTQPTKTDYNYGDTFDPAGMVVTATLSDNSTEVLDSADYSFAPNTPLTLADTTITISYTANTAITDTVTITVTAVLEDITITTQPTKVDYIVGETFETAGMVVEANYNDGTDTIITDSDYTFSPNTPLTEADTTVTISYEGFSKPVTITVKNVLTGIDITTPPTKTDYYTGQVFDTTGMVVEATYADATTDDVTGFTFAPNTPLTTADTTIVISYEEDGVTETANQAITVTQDEVSSIAVTTQPTKVTYNDGESFDPTDMVVTATYLSGDTEALTNTEYTITPNRALTTTDTEMTITYDANTSLTTTVPITVNPVLTGISITTPPDKVVYNDGDTIDITGMIVEAEYSNSTTEPISDTEYTYTPNGTVTTTDTELEVSYEGFNDSVTITVNRVLTSIAITTPPDDVTYTAGEFFNPDGMVVQATYSDSTTDDNVTGYTFTPDASTALQTTDTEVVISYTEGDVTETENQPITVT